MKKQLHLPGEIILQFLQDNEEGIRQILTWFLNTIMEYEAQLQAGAMHYDGTLELLKSQLREFPFQYLFVDASYYKVRDEMAEIREDGYREILGLKLAESEGEDFWLELFEELKNRGLGGVELVVSDGHKGIRSAVEKDEENSLWWDIGHFYSNFLTQPVYLATSAISRRR